MKIVTRYILRESLVFFSISLFAFTSVLLTIKMLHFAALIVDKGVEIGQIASVFIAIVPTFLEIAIPLSTLLGVMLAFARLSGDSEVVVMRASGISLYQIVRPVFIFGLSAGLVGLMVSHQLKPWGYQQLSATLFDIARTKSTSGLEEGVFNKLGPLTVYAEKIDDLSGALTKVLIEDRRDKTNKKVLTGKSGNIISDPVKRTITIKLKDGAILEIAEGKYTVTNFNTNLISMSPDDLFNADGKRQAKQSAELSLSQLKEGIQYYPQLLPLIAKGEMLDPANFPKPIPSSVVLEPVSREMVKKKLLRMKLELGQRFSLPFASFALALLAMPLGVQPPRTQRTWGAGLSASLGMGVFVFYYGLFSIGIVMAQSGAIEPALALWLPNVCVLLVAAYMIHKTASEKWQSIAHGFENITKLIPKRTKRTKEA